MKIIEGLKQIKDLSKKADDLIKKAMTYCVNMDFENPVYPDQQSQVNTWVQSHRDIIHEISRLRYCIQKTNCTVKVKIRINDQDIEKSIAEWIHRRKDLSKMEAMMWLSLTDRNLKDSRTQMPSGIVDAKVRRYYDPVLRDKMLTSLQSEPSLIDGKLEIVNATTDLME